VNRALAAADRERRRTLTRLLAGALAVAGAGAALRRASAQQLLPATQGVHRLDGEVSINGRAARVGDRVRPGDTVATGRRSYAMFVLGEDAWLLRENTAVEAGATLAQFMRVVTGMVLGVFGKSAQTRRIGTAAATIGIRGTGGYIEAEPLRTYFCLCYGGAEIAANARPEQREIYVSNYHEAPRFIHGDGREQAIEEAPVFNHADAELLMLEALVGRTPPPGFLANARYI
jgi:hypothetical protein